MPDPTPPVVPLGVLPPSIRDARQTAFVNMLSAELAALDMPRIAMTDPLTVDARLLPYMVREFSAQRFIYADAPEIVQRRVLSRIFDLHKLTGFDAGVRLGLSLLGMDVVISQWYDRDPVGAPSTHILTVFVDDILYPDEGGHFSPRQLGAMRRMIDATKRWSQGTEIRAGVIAKPQAYVGVHAATHIVATADYDIPPAPVNIVANRFAVVATTIVHATAQAA